LQALELVIFAALAAVVLFQLYAVLGRRVGRQPEDAAEVEARRPAAEIEARRPDDTHPAEAATGIAAVRARDPSFDPAGFLQGAKSAYEMTVLAFSEGDRPTLKNLLTPSVYGTFDTALAQREAEGRSETTEFLQAPRADLEDVALVGDMARVKVRFLAEFRTRSKGPEGEAVDDRRTAEIWTFERNVNSRDPNWALAQVEPAEV
jgi:predicted lipid-binding transport protein (Tim44 family)